MLKALTEIKNNGCDDFAVIAKFVTLQRFSFVCASIARPLQTQWFSYLSIQLHLLLLPAFDVLCSRLVSPFLCVYL